MDPHKTDMNVPQHYATMRFDITGVQNWDVMSTFLGVTISCVDENGKVLHEIIQRSVPYTDYALSYAMLREMTTCLRILVTEKLTHKPYKNVEIVLHDYVAFMFASKQFHTPVSSLKEWMRGIRPLLATSQLPCTIKLGSPTFKAEFRRFTYALWDNVESLTPTPEMLGDTQRQFVKEQCKLRGLC